MEKYLPQSEADANGRALSKCVFFSLIFLLILIVQDNYLMYFYITLVFCLFRIDMQELGMSDYIIQMWNDWFREWKYEMHNHCKTFESHEEALTRPPLEFGHRMDEWHCLCSYFQILQILEMDVFRGEKVFRRVKQFPIIFFYLNIIAQTCGFINEINLLNMMILI